MPELPDTNKQRARDMNKSPHLVSLLITLTLYGVIATCFTCYFTSAISEDTCKSNSNLWVWISVISYLVYWIECCCSGSQKYLLNDMEATGYEQFIQKIKASAPQIGTAIECYHYETRTRTVYSTDSDGKETSHEETYTEKVTTYRGREYFNYKSWVDTTGEVVGVIGGDLIKLEVKKMYVFDSAASQLKFENHRRNYIDSNRYRDDHIDSSDIFEIPGHLPKVLVQNKGTVRPCCLEIGWFWIWSFFLLSWPYRMWFEKLSDTKRIILSKMVYA